MFDLKQLQESSKQYFEKDEKVALMYATADGHFFYEKDKNYADSHAREHDLNVFTIKRGDIGLKSAASADTDDGKEGGEKQLADMTKKELNAIVAGLEGVDPDVAKKLSKKKNDDIIAFIEGYEAPASEEDPEEEGGEEGSDPNKVEEEEK